MSSAAVTTYVATTAAASTDSTSDAVPKSIITICILVGGFLIGVLIAKLVNYCYNRADVPDNASDISEHTKGLLRIQLALLKMGKSSGFGGADGEAGGDPEEVKRQQQATVLSMWKMKAMNKAAAAQKAQEETAGGASVQVVNETAIGNKKGKTGAGGKAAANTKPKPVVKPKKLFPNSLSGIAPTEAPAPAAAAVTATASKAAASTSKDTPGSITAGGAATSAPKPLAAKAKPAVAGQATAKVGSAKARPPTASSETPAAATAGGKPKAAASSSNPGSPESNA